MMVSILFEKLTLFLLNWLACPNVYFLNRLKAVVLLSFALYIGVIEELMLPSILLRKLNRFGLFKEMITDDILSGLTLSVGLFIIVVTADFNWCTPFYS